ncbi:HET-domain-containing protein, partial [Lophium mytilinum]
MASSSSQPCLHRDIYVGIDYRSCLSCGFALLHDNRVHIDTRTDTDSTPKPGSRYSYRPLNFELGQEIRLLVLHSGQPSDPIVCDLVHANLLDHPEYEAISYTWANSDLEVSFDSKLIDSRSRQVLNVTENCDAALRQVRLQDGKRVVWIDSVCINQDNVSERNHQVWLMKNIYANAIQVLVYVGGPSGDGFELLEYLSHCLVVRSGRSVEVLPKPGAQIPSAAAVQQFFERRWFHRTWTLQEVALAKRATVVLSANIQAKTYDFLSCLVAGRNCAASDPRDKVFALLGLIDEQSGISLRADYSKGVSWVFSEVACQIVE